MLEHGIAVTEDDVAHVVRTTFTKGVATGYADGVRVGKSLERRANRRRAFWLRVLAFAYGAALATLVYVVVDLAQRGVA